MNDVPPLVPRLGDIRPADGRCNRLIGDGYCGAPAATHIIWTDDTENGLACSVHAAEAVVEWAPIWTHDYASGVCAAPGSFFHRELNVCYFPPDEDGTPARAAAVEVSA